MKNLMTTWKTPVMAALVSAGFIVSFSAPATSVGQTVPSIQQTVFAQDSQPFSKAFEPQEKLRRESVAALPQLAEPEQDQGTQLTRDENANAAPGIGMPTVIVRLPSTPTQSLNGLTVDVEKIVTLTGDHYSLKLQIPESVKVIEVTPVSETDKARRFKIQVAETGEARSLIAPGLGHSAGSVPEARPIRIASALGSDFSNSRHSSHPMGAGQTVPHKSQDLQSEASFPVRKGFQKNPFFGTAGSDLDQNTASTMLPTTGYVVQADGPETTSHPQLASYRSADSRPGSPAELSEPVSTGPVFSEMTGPTELALGDIADFMIYVANTSTAPVTGLDVNLTVPAGLNVLVVDREAAIDTNSGTLKWNLGELLPGEERFIKYRVQSVEKGAQSQGLLIRMDDRDILEVDFTADVQVLTESSVAPLLPFESQ